MSQRGSPALWAAPGPSGFSTARHRDYGATSQRRGVHDDSALSDRDSSPPTPKDAMGEHPFLWGEVLLENTQNTARDHMSNERTMLSYIRTAVSLASAGVAFTEFFNKIRMRADVPGRPAIHDYSGLIGGALIALGVVLLSIGIYRYYSVQATIQAGRFLPSRPHVYLVNTWLGAVICMTAAVILIVPR